MKRILVKALIAVAVLGLYTLPASADTIDSSLFDPNVFVCGNCTTTGGDPNIITSPSNMSVGILGNHTLVNPLLIIVGVPNGGPAPDVKFGATTYEQGGTQVWGLNSTAAAGTAVSFTSSSSDVCATLGLNNGHTKGSGSDCSSESFVNWTTHAGVLPVDQHSTSFSLYVFELPVSLTGKNPIKISLTDTTTGSFVMGYGCEIASVSNGQCTPVGNVGSTPFTTVGLIESAPEPGTFALFGAGLLALGGLSMRRLFAGRR